ncbi:hypothetical protein [Butyrivibrio sp. INlla16]|uniref:hypothetical protein n=1 Tax=Butyrivibrio sp. INlla16 TaxID=1520807 RepID=UPI000890344F|nr:hypothetical protein [Butyrivibrio sp. INlla16]SDB50706.1 hypothetical protein SAMN02910263_02539 [Butyrivibrio sp. INlla16]
MFTYIKPEFMIHAFTKQRDTTLKDRSICVARLGDLAVNMSLIDENSFALSLENVKDGAQYSGRAFNIKKSAEEDIVPIVEDLFRKMQLLNDQEVFNKREHVWKMYAMDWLENQGISFDDYIDSRMSHLTKDEGFHWKGLEEYLSSDYLNVVDTMRIIEKYSQSEEEKKEYIDFVARDIVELRRHYSLAAMQEKFDEHNARFANRKMFAFGIEVEADSRDEAREKLKKIIGEEKETFVIRG